jgi:cation:H+ antiporter
MAIHFGIIVLYLYAFYLVAILFTNGIEWLGVRFKLPAGALGSVFAAVGTALPETLIALIAVFSGTVSSHDIGIGAILGAPFLLSSIAFFVIGFTYLLSRKQGVRTNPFDIDTTVIRTDFDFFLIAFTVAALAGLYTPWLVGVEVAGYEMARLLHIVLGVILLVVYVLYVVKVMGKGGEFLEEPKPLLIVKWTLKILPILGLRMVSAAKNIEEAPKRRYIIVQLIGSLAILFLLARGFVNEIEWLSEAIRMPALIISLLIIPVATELPEKLNSIIWVRGNHDTLAMGNVSGAMVFQSSIPVTIGLWFTEWSFAPLSFAFATCVLTLISGLLVRIDLHRTGEIQPRTLMLGALFYVAFIALVVFRVFPQ